MTVNAADSVKVQWAGTGTGTMTLGSAVSGFQAPPASLNGLQVSYLIEHTAADIVERENGKGTYTHSGTTLSRTAVSYSTNSNNLVNFSVGTKHVSIVLLAQDLGALADQDIVTAALTADDVGVYNTVTDTGNYSESQSPLSVFTVSTVYNQERRFSTAANHIIEFPAGLTVGSYGAFKAPSANTLDIRRVSGSGVSIDGIAANGQLAGSVGIVPAGGRRVWWVVDTNTVLTWGDTAAAQTAPGALTVTGTLTASSSIFQVEKAAADADVAGDGQWWTLNATPNRALFTNDAGADMELDGGLVITSVSGALTRAVHHNNTIVTSGNVTVPNASTDVGFQCNIIAGGAHTVAFNSTTSAAMASGGVMTVLVQSTTVIKAVYTAPADLVSFT